MTSRGIGLAVLALLTLCALGTRPLFFFSASDLSCCTDARAAVSFSSLFFRLPLVPTCVGGSDHVRASSEGTGDKRWHALAEQVRDQTKRVWGSYVRYARGFDEIRPIDNTGSDWYAGASIVMTPVDAIDTLLLMGLWDEAREATAIVLERFEPEHVDAFVSGFEINIRHVGGLLSAYQLTCDDRFLRLAERLVTCMLPLFTSPTGIPYTEVHLMRGTARGSATSPTGSGTFLIEMATLSRLTGNRTYETLARRAVDALYSRRSRLDLAGDAIDAIDGRWTSEESTIGAGSDSYYEYMAKCWVLLDDDTYCATMWNASFVAIDRYMSDERGGWLWYGSADMHTGRRTATFYGALAAFFPSVMALTGHVERASALHRSSHRMWTLYGLEPETLDYATMSLVRADYLLRPEIIESAYYLYHFTRDPRYLEMGEVYWNAILTRCATESAFSEISDVRSGGGRYDRMQSFMLAETLKYLYLLFVTGGERAMAPLGTGAHEPTGGFKLDEMLDTMVFNTEGHPLFKNPRPGLCVDLRRPA